MNAHSLYLIDGTQNDFGLKPKAKSSLKVLTPLRVVFKMVTWSLKAIPKTSSKHGLATFDLELPVPSLRGLEVIQQQVRVSNVA